MSLVEHWIKSPESSEVIVGASVTIYTLNVIIKIITEMMRFFVIFIPIGTITITKFIKSFVQ